MAQSYSSARVDAPLDVVYQVVADIESYPQFVPACKAARVLSRTEDGDLEYLDAELQIHLGFLNKTFTTSNVNTRQQSINITLQSGSVHQLEGEWRFQRVDDTTTEVSCEVAFHLGSSAVNMLAEKALKKFIQQLSQAFVDRALSVYEHALR